MMGSFSEDLAIFSAKVESMILTNRVSGNRVT